MEPISTPCLSPQELVRLVWARRNLWLATTFVCGVLAAAFTWVIANFVARNLAQVRVDREQLIQRLRRAPASSPTCTK